MTLDITRERDAAKDWVKTHELSRDDLTGALSRREFFTFLNIARELGHDEVSVLACDMNFLKDYNDRLGDPPGGDFGLAVAARILQDVAQEYGQLVARFNQGGGDDFLVFGFPVSDKPDNFLEEEIKRRLKLIELEELLNGKFKGKEMYKYNTSIKLAPIPEKAEALRKLPELMELIIPPSFTFEKVGINLQSDITKSEPSGILDFSNVDSMFTNIFDKTIKAKKRSFYTQLKHSNPKGYELLARK